MPALLLLSALYDATDLRVRARSCIVVDRCACARPLPKTCITVVYRGRYEQTSVAVKRLKFQHLNQELMTKFNQELTILSRVRHRNVVRFVGAVVEQPNLCVVMEFMEGGTLYDLIHKNNVALELPQLLQIALDVAQGCNYLHRQKPIIIHRDLKSQNILMTPSGLAKIADFGA
eukprot:6180825-Pleurochrysis_carterae.AAC.4